MDIENYEINRDTCALININGEATQVLEKTHEYIITKSTYEVMDNSCAYYGSSLDGRIKGTKMILGSNYKLPIVIEEKNDIIFFPTTGSNNGNCSWVSLNHIQKYEPYKGYTKVKFYDGKTIVLKMSCPSFETQLFRAMRLQKILEERRVKEVEDLIQPKPKRRRSKKTND